MSDDQGATPTEPTPDPADAAPRNEDAPLGEAGQKALDAFKARAREAEAKAKELEARVSEFEEASSSELEKLTNKATKAEQAKAEAEGKLLRFEVAAEKAIPADALDLLTGNTREELEAKADKLLGLIKNRTDTDTEPDFDGGAREPAPDPKTPEQAHNELAAALFGAPTQ